MIAHTARKVQTLCEGRAIFEGKIMPSNGTFFAFVGLPDQQRRKSVFTTTFCIFGSDEYIDSMLFFFVSAANANSPDKCC